MMQDGIGAGLRALGDFGDVIRAALLTGVRPNEVMAQVKACEAGLARLSAEAAGQCRPDTSERIDALRAALSCIAAHLARGDLLAALQALDAGSFPRALEAACAHLSPPVAAEEGAVA